ncbi:hypothetical protein DPEC_G00241680 [Dallia pectoralis]|uniref:Uncharacterized protein n=1 Tax=Dallia pectoralis TaxID=75939 RepID=A0ACC2FV79_DALPE|nr:hypothetical protein DPEC_G00241680 [Dallia pectoralis]
MPRRERQADSRKRGRCPLTVPLSRVSDGLSPPSPREKDGRKSAASLPPKGALNPLALASLTVPETDPRRSLESLKPLGWDEPLSQSTAFNGHRLTESLSLADSHTPTQETCRRQPVRDDCFPPDTDQDITAGPRGNRQRWSREASDTPSKSGVAVPSPTCAMRAPMRRADPHSSAFLSATTRLSIFPPGRNGALSHVPGLRA